jgi:hypothetical protein
MKCPISRPGLWLLWSLRRSAPQVALWVVKREKLLAEGCCEPGDETVVGPAIVGD